MSAEHIIITAAEEIADVEEWQDQDGSVGKGGVLLVLFSYVEAERGFGVRSGFGRELKCV